MASVNQKLEEVTAEAQATRSDRDILRVQLDSINLQLEQKSKELAIALTSLGDIQRVSMVRENQLREQVDEQRDKA